MRQQLKINNIWAVLPQNFKVTIKRTNPLFNNEGDFSFPFSLDPRLNKPIIESACDPHGRFSLRRLNGLPIEYWFDGQLMFRGYTEVKDSLQFKDTIQLNFNSGVRSITEQVKDMNAQDVSVERWQLGYACTGIRFAQERKAELVTWENVLAWGQLFGGAAIVTARYDHVLCPAFDTEYADAPVKNALYTSPDAINVIKDSREFPYCNTRVAIDLEDANRLLVLDANRRDSAPCMYVLYWLKRLFKDLGISITNEFEQMEDMTRLAFFSTFPKYTTEDWSTLPSYNNPPSIPAEQQVHFHAYRNPYTNDVTPFGTWDMWRDIIPQFEFGLPYLCRAVFFHANMQVHQKNPLSTGTGMNFSPFGLVTAKKGEQPYEPACEHTFEGIEGEYGFRPAFLSSEQYPNTKVQTILDDLHDIFGLRIIYDTVTNHARVLYIKDVFANAPVLPFPAEFHTEPVVTRTLNPGIIVTYGKERADDSFSVAEAAYDYDMPENERMVVQQPFSDTLRMVFNSTDHKTYYDPKTGNTAIIAIDEESDADNQDATAMEVGQWNDYRYAVNDPDKAKSYKANFEPIVCNNVVAGAATVPATVPNASALGNSNLVPYPGADQNCVSTDNMYETFQSNERTIEPPADGNLLTLWLGDWYEITEAGKYGYGLLPDIDNLNGQPLYKLSILIDYASNNGECCDMTKDDSPLQKWQDGKHYVLGFMRGAGNDSGLEFDMGTAENPVFNDDGTRGWKSVVGTPTFTADSVDQFGNVFDYNGKETGGIDQSERLSLKLDARKVKSYDEEGNPTFYPIDADLANRGVAVKMLSSFLHFDTHHHKVTRKATVAVGFIMDIDWCAQYDMQQCVGFVNSIQFELSENGVGESTIEQLVME